MNNRDEKLAQGTCSDADKTARSPRIGFLGFGNMAQAMAQGLLRKEVLPAANIHACAKHFDKLKNTCAAYGCVAHESAAEVAAASDIVVVAVKPYLVKEVLAPIAEKLKGKIVFSVSAGMDFDTYEDIIPGVHHWSSVPNTPVSVCEGIYICEERHNLTDDEYQLVNDVFSPTGLIVPLDHKQYSPGSTLAGCGPAFAAMFIEALADGAVKNGLQRPMAYRLASQMLVGTAKLQLESDTHPGAMKDAVCSPGGLTIKGVAALEDGGLRSAVISSIDVIEKK